LLGAVVPAIILLVPWLRRITVLPFVSWRTDRRWVVATGMSTGWPAGSAHLPAGNPGIYTSHVPSLAEF
jgi:hypothetical protein